MNSKTLRIHIIGASGSGVSTLGLQLASALACSHHDTDDYYWLPTNPPYQSPRLVEERVRLMKALFLTRDRWVLSGSSGEWIDPVIPYLDLVVFVRTPTAVRLERLKTRENQRFGPEANRPGGWNHEGYEWFLDWPASTTRARVKGGVYPNKRHG